jgi:predicted ATPase with chaperone activity
VLKIARTIADLEQAPDIRVRHVSEGVQYRSLDRGSLFG